MKKVLIKNEDIEQYIVHNLEVEKMVVNFLDNKKHFKVTAERDKNIIIEGINTGDFSKFASRQYAILEKLIINHQVDYQIDIILDGTSDQFCNIDGLTVDYHSENVTINGKYCYNLTKKEDLKELKGYLLQLKGVYND
jgi:hypothetical protein